MQKKLQNALKTKKMATFTPCVRSKKDFNPVHIRISNNAKTDYIKTNFVVHKSNIQKGTITDSLVQANCALLIKSYYDKIGSRIISHWTVQELKKFLLDEQEDISFTKFAKYYQDKLYNEGRTNTLACYKLAVNSLHTFFAKENIFFHYCPVKPQNRLFHKLIS